MLSPVEFFAEAGVDFVLGVALGSLGHFAGV